MKRYILFLLAFGLFLAGCTTQPAQEPAQQAPQQPAQQFVCPDGVTVVANLASCPPYDKEYEECLDLPATSDYGPSMRDECFYNLAFERENISLCKKVLYDDGYSYYSDVSQSKCGAMLAMYLGDETLCEELGLIGKAGCYSALAIELEDPEICDAISTTSKKDECLYNYLSQNQYYLSEWSICDRFSEKSDNRDYCYYVAAVNSDTLSYCDEITGSGGMFGYSQSTCYASVARARNTPSVCAGLPSTVKIDQCYYDYATSYPYDESACNRITDSYKKDDCLWMTNDSYWY